MKKIFSSAMPVLSPLKKKFKEAGCECSLKKDKHKTVLTIGYTNIVPIKQQTRSAG
jgi:hypothetical protein